MAATETQPGAMRPESREGGDGLRTGLTTGACATAASLAAARLALTGTVCNDATIRLPRGQYVSLPLEALYSVPEGAEAEVIKDAGDDPDATHGASIQVRVTLAERPGFRFHAGPGVGTVTRAGLPVAIGEPAINPVPRRMITEHLEELATECGYSGGFEVTVAIEGGERIAQRTMNPRLGIQGGLSILGTTGIVRPFSCAAYIASIHQAVDVARANGIDRVACCTGGTSEAFARSWFGLDDMALIEMGDFFGATLKYLRRHPLDQVLLVAGFGKLGKFAAGHPDTHSRKCAVDFVFLAREAEVAGAGPELAERIRHCNTSIEALEACQADAIPLGDRIAALALEQARTALPAATHVAVHAIDRAGNPVGHAEGESP